MGQATAVLRTLYKRLPPSAQERLRTLAAGVPFGRISPSDRKLLRFLRSAQFWSGERIRSWQLERLRGVVAYACQHTEGYRDLYQNAGVSARDIRCIDDVKHLPFTTKQLFQDNLEAFTVKTRDREYVTTGGSTGIPFGFYQSRGASATENTFMHCGWDWFGWKPGFRSAVLRGAFVGSDKGPTRFDPYKTELFLSSYHLTEESLPKYLAALDQYRPRVLRAYASSLNILCDVLRNAGSERRPQFDLILLGSENVYPWQLSKFRHMFPGSRIVSWYGSAEKVILAPWCEETMSYHAWPFYGLTEVLRSDGRRAEIGEQGELVGTSFWHLVTPFIRYRTADFATTGEHACRRCGRAFPLLTDVVGRAHEFIESGAGRYISMTAINMHDDVFDSIRQFQFVQEERGVVTFKYVPRSVGADLNRIHAGLARKLGNDVKIRFDRVDEIQPTRSGKHRFLDQRLDIKYGDPS